MKAVCSSKLYISEPTPELLDYCKQNLMFPNPEYIKLEAMGKWTGRTQKDIVLWERIGNDVVLPFGCLRYVWDNFKHDFTDFRANIAPMRHFVYNTEINLYDYQERVVEKALKAKNGVIIMPCGSGKTQTALELVARLGGKTLWLTHTAELLQQSMDRAKSCYSGLEKGDYGTITNGKVDIGRVITFATVQTMCRVNLQDYKYAFDVIVVDECHKCVGTPTNVMMFYKVLSNLSARYKFGLTATPKRADGLERCMFSLLGDTIDEVTQDEVAMNTCPVCVKKRFTGYQPNENVITASDGTIVYSSLIDDMIANEERNKVIVDDLRKLDGSCLILTDRLAHIDTLEKMLNAGDIACAIKGTSNSKSSRERRKTVLQDLNRGKLKYVFATYKLAKEGLDIPNLRYVVFATPQKDYTTVIQSAGRVGRKAEGKEYGTVIDYVDEFGMLYGYSRKRNTYYKKHNYEVNVEIFTV